jgi:C4-dicarboxylate-binding protein DctP
MMRILIAAAVAAFVIQPAVAQSPVIIKFSHVVAPDTPKGNAAEKFKELAAKYTGGRAKIEV